MLQQTRVETVIPYYERFLARFPTPTALAEAPDDDVLSLWSGLGYYRRARLLVAGMRDVVTRYGGEVPRDAEALRSLPGVGAYTAGAIASIAFDLREPIVDGNVARVLARVHRVQTPLGERATDVALWAHARAWADGERPGATNQALMELGATLCRKGTPECAPCPLAALCAARRLGETQTLPRPKARAKQKAVQLVALVACHGEGDAATTYLERSTGNLFAGLYVPPMRALADDADAGAEARALARTLGVDADLAHAADVAHVLTHRKLAIAVYVARGPATGDGVRAFTRGAIAEVGVPSLTRKVLRASGFGETPGAARRAASRAGTARTPRAPRRSGRTRAADR